MKISKFVPNKENWKKLREFYDSLTVEKETFQASWQTFTHAKFLFVAWSTDKIIGVSGVNERYHTFTVIKSDFQGQGFGQKMFKIRRREIERLGFKKIRAQTFNPVPLHIVKKEGYKELYTVNAVHYFELPLSTMTKLTFPFRKIAYILYAKLWRSWHG